MPYYPALIFGMLLTIYWARVIRLVYKVRRTTGRSANLKPPETLGRLLRFVWIPIVTVWIGHGYLSALVRPEDLPWIVRPLFQKLLLAWLAAFVGAAALAATIVCWKKMGKSWRMGINPDEKTQLIVSGPYAYLRHPIYALSSILMLATVLAIPSPLMLAVGVIHLSLLRWEAAREERYLLLHHGEGYRDYLGKVGGFLPRSLRAYRAGSPSR